jgi:transposase InsO family protein
MRDGRFTPIRAISGTQQRPKTGLFEVSNWFNHRRLLEPIGNIPPAEAEERYYAMLDDTPMAA